MDVAELQRHLQGACESVLLLSKIPEDRLLSPIRISVFLRKRLLFVHSQDAGGFWTAHAALEAEAWPAGVGEAAAELANYALQQCSEHKRRHIGGMLASELGDLALQMDLDVGKPGAIARAIYLAPSPARGQAAALLLGELQVQGERPH